jgi:hypothetical protein
MDLLSRATRTSVRGSRCRAGLSFLLVLLAALAPLEPLRSEASREYQLKAAFLFNFAQFVEWPDSSFADAKAPFVIGVLGDDPFGTFLDQLVQGELIRDRAVVVRRFDNLNDARGCQILFVSRSEASRWKMIADEMKGHSVLTVADGNGAARGDGIIRFAMESGKIRLVVDVDGARASELRISSKLLRTAQIVNSGKG